MTNVNEFKTLTANERIQRLESLRDQQLLSLSKSLRSSLKGSVEFVCLPDIRYILELIPILLKHISKSKKDKLKEYYGFEYSRCVELAIGIIPKLFIKQYSKDLSKVLFFAITGDYRNKKPASRFVQIARNNRQFISSIIHQLTIQLSETYRDEYAWKLIRLFDQCHCQCITIREAVSIFHVCSKWFSVIFSTSNLLDPENLIVLFESIGLIFRIAQNFDHTDFENDMLPKMANTLVHILSKLCDLSGVISNFALFQMTLKALSVITQKCHVTKSDLTHEHRYKQFLAYFNTLSQRLNSSSGNLAELDALTSVCEILSLLPISITAISTEIERETIEMSSTHICKWFKSLTLALIDDQGTVQAEANIIKLINPAFIEAWLGLCISQWKITWEWPTDCLSECKILMELFQLLQIIKTESYKLLYGESRSNRVYYVTLNAISKLLIHPALDCDELLNELPLSLVRLIPEEFGPPIQRYFSTQPELDCSEIGKVLFITSKLLAHSYCRTIFIDLEFPQYLIQEQYIQRIINVKSQMQENCVLLMLQCIKNLFIDSSLRFKMKNNVNGVIRLFTLITQECYNRNVNTPHLDALLSKCVGFLNEHYGHDQFVLQILCTPFKVGEPVDITDENDISFFSLLISILELACAQQLSLDILESGLSLDSVVVVGHLLDSILCFERGKMLLLKSNKLRLLTQMMLDMIEHPNVAKILEKILCRILTDLEMTMRVCQLGGFIDIFEVLVTKEINTKHLRELETSILCYRQSFIPIMLSLFHYKPNTSEDFNLATFKSALSILYVCADLIIKPFLLDSIEVGSIVTRETAMNIIQVILLGLRTDTPFSSSEHVNIALRYLDTKVNDFSNASSFKGNMTFEKPVSSTTSRLLFLLEHQDILMSVKAENIQPSQSISFIFADSDPSRMYAFDCCNLIETSPVFKAMINGPFSESKNGAITLHDVEVDTWTFLLLYLSTIETRDPVGFTESTCLAKCLRIFEVYQLGNEYLVTSLLMDVIEWLKDFIIFSTNTGQFETIYTVYSWLQDFDSLFNPVYHKDLIGLSLRGLICTLHNRISK
ncbi:hypothetical protein HDV02_002912 [Globomyces sp. JEL0801]|nr:hypothetical protein HDV02_002912 [Globomyces sp. JEL0801]